MNECQEMVLRIAGGIILGLVITMIFVWWIERD